MKRIVLLRSIGDRNGQSGHSVLMRVKRASILISCFIYISFVFVFLYFAVVLLLNASFVVDILIAIVTMIKITLHWKWKTE